MKTKINLHVHTHYSYNAYDYSPIDFAYRAKSEGLTIAGIVDFDTLDGIDEFFSSCKILELKACGSIESRVFLSAFPETVFNSPGEPGILYHMGVGFTKKIDHPFLQKARGISEKRVELMVEKVNDYLKPVTLDFLDLLKLTPNSYVTERHVCEAYVNKAKEIFSKVEGAKFWEIKLGEYPGAGTALQNLIRSKTMKKGGIGYAQPDENSFPKIEEMNQFILDSGAIPTLAWLDGMSDGESNAENLFAIAMSYEMAAINIIPDRNYQPGDSITGSIKYNNLLKIVKMAEYYGFPIIVGTEMNAPGNKFVDSFETAELAPLLPIFLKGAYIIYGHTVLQRQCGLGYLSEWAKESFPTVFEKNKFFEKIGSKLNTKDEDYLKKFNITSKPSEILGKIP